MACVMDVGGWMVREYMNMFEVVAMTGDFRPASGTLASNAHQVRSAPGVVRIVK